MERATLPNGFAIGIDVIEPARIERAVANRGEAFLDRIFTEEERAYCDRMASRWLHYAARFAAKEAFGKALGTGMRGLRWRDVTVRREPNGRPVLVIKWPAGIASRPATVSLSHTHGVAAAVVLLGPPEPAA